jgi:predicted transcriptional regulator
LSVLSRLHAKGLLDRRRFGRADIYIPALSEAEYRLAWSTALIAAGENRTALMRSCHGLAAMLISADQTIATPAFPSF